MPDQRPTHVVAEPGNRLALCGVRDPLPVVWAQAAQAHIDGYGMVLCAACEQAWRCT